MWRILSWAFPMQSQKIKYNVQQYSTTFLSIYHFCQFRWFCDQNVLFLFSLMTFANPLIVNIHKATLDSRTRQTILSLQRLKSLSRSDWLMDSSLYNLHFILVLIFGFYLINKNSCRWLFLIITCLSRHIFVCYMLMATWLVSRYLHLNGFDILSSYTLSSS